jgi:hypothetical protein
MRRSVKPKEMMRAVDPPCEVQSVKPSVEITSPYEGIARKFLIQEGEIAKVGRVSAYRSYRRGVLVCPQGTYSWGAIEQVGRKAIVHRNSGS